MVRYFMRSVRCYQFSRFKLDLMIVKLLPIKLEKDWNIWEFFRVNYNQRLALCFRVT